LLTPRQTTLAWSSAFPVCVSTTPGISSATSPGGGGYTITAACIDLQNSPPTGGSQRINWSNGDYSVFSWDAEDVVVLTGAGSGTIVVHAEVTEGLYLGHTLIETVISAELNLLACLAEPGRTQSSDSVTITVLPL
jgi:hypothetical protein